MHIAALARKASKVVIDHSPAILTAFGISGTLTTAYLSAKAAYASRPLLDEGARKADLYGEPFEIREQVVLVWKTYIPAIATATLTVTCIIAATKVGQRRTAAITAAYSITEKAFDEYREKVTEKLGEKKEKALRDEIHQDRVNNNPPSREIVVATGQVVCLETYSGRYFTSDMETLRRSQNDINAKLHREDVASLSDFYYMIGLAPTSHSTVVGWTSDKQMELRTGLALTDDNRPCITFEYNYIKPIH